ncbi:MAG: LPS export ABC transporter periplasmic protein LptC [Flavobacteriia bacterium]|nr:LPS export ABC transporter periplasmic protein LptC [Flavobacteriia bacterium]
MSYRILRGIALAVPLFLILNACQNDPKVVKEVINEYDGPLRTQDDVTYTYTDSGVVVLRFQAAKAIDFSHLEDEPYLEFPEGIDVTFYNDTGAVETHLTANYAKRFIEESRWEAEGDVHVVNSKEEELQSEKLEWDEGEERISSDDAVSISTPESKIWGKGFDADQHMNDYEIHEVYGTIFLNEEDNDSTSTPDL